MLINQIFGNISETELFAEYFEELSMIQNLF